MNSIVNWWKSLNLPQQLSFAFMGMLITFAMIALPWFVIGVGLFLGFVGSLATIIMYFIERND